MNQKNLTTLPNRVGDRPKTGAQPPHLQYSDTSSREIYDAMSQWALVDLP